MPKYTKFAIKENVLVYRNTGQPYQKGYRIQGNTVYSKKTGRKIGTISKNLTKAQKEKIERAYQNRQQKIKKMIKKFGIPVEGNLSYETLSMTGEMRGYINVPLSKFETSLQNFAMMLDKAVKEGVMDSETARAFLNRYLGARDDTERNRIWKDFKVYAKEQDWKYIGD